MTPVVVSSVEPMISEACEDAGGVQLGDQVRAVIHGDVGVGVQCGVQMAVVGLAVLALDGKGRDTVNLHQSRRHVILGGEGVGGAGVNVGAARLQGGQQVGGLGGDVQAGRQPDALQGLFLLEASA